ncbi:MAG: ComF family protein [Anaerolineales bacterium]|nr:ComF family protein [Anaerolineales bacterium]
MKKQPLPYLMYRSLWYALDLLFPPLCGGCDKLGSRWCADCQRSVITLSGIVCDVCGLPQDVAGVCDACRADRPHFRALRAWAVFDTSLQRALHKLKYKRDISMGDALAAQMTDFAQGLNWRADILVPIPLGKQRLKERGYNQVGMIAKPLAMALNMQYAPRGLTRCKETRSQVGLSKRERKENINGAFQAWKGVSGKNVIVFDDVSTTGSTLSSSADALLSAGAKEVYALTVARALPHHGLKHA